MATQLSPDSELRTQDRVRTMVAESGPISAAHVAKNLGLTPAAVRRHLDNLASAGVIEVKLVTPEHLKAGRPARRYVLSAQGQIELGDDYLSIATSALKSLAQANPEAVREFAQARALAFEDKARPRIQAHESIEAKARELAAALREEGFVSSVSELGAGSQMTGSQAAGSQAASAKSASTPAASSPAASSKTGKVAKGAKDPAAHNPHLLGAIQLCQGHCPVQGLAEEFPEFCEAESEMFARLLGVDIRRLSTLAAGSHVCTTHIPLARVATNTHKEGVR